MDRLHLASRGPPPPVYAVLDEAHSGGHLGMQSVPQGAGWRCLHTQVSATTLNIVLLIKS